MSKELISTKTCMVCGQNGGVELTPEEVAAFDAYQKNPKILIQQALPNVSAEDREMLKTGTHPACWDSIFASMDEMDAEYPA